jgi:polyisoprenoid-binding protein YceI
MTRKILIAVWAVLAMAAAGTVIWFYAAGNVGDSTEVTAPPITASQTAPESAEVTQETVPVSTDTTEVSSSSTTVISEQPEAGEDVNTQSTEVGSDLTELQDPPENVVELQLADGSEARFLIYEDLRGEPFTVVGVTSDLVGRIQVNRAELGASQIGEILINARTFVTDSSNRDRAIRGPILNAEQFEFIAFRPLGTSGLSGAAQPGGEWSFVVEGELTIRDITRPVTFEVVATWREGDLLEGRASATVLRADFNLSVPSVPFVANVADEIGLELDFIASPDGLG